MASFKSHPFFYTSLLLAGALTAGQAWMLFSQRSAAQKISAEIEQKKAALEAFQRQNPFPSRENLQAVEADRLEAEKTLGEIRNLLQSQSAVSDAIAAAVPPASPTDAYFDIANYVERLRSQAREAKVGFSPDNRFGFSAYATTGPDRGLIEQVFQQRQYAEYLIGALLGSSNPPKEFLGLQREQPISAERRRQIEEAAAQGLPPPATDAGSSGGAGGTGDYFTMDPRTSARVPGSVASIPFRLSFVGNTAVLRDFLNELALFKVPVVVRSVEVESLNANRPSSPASSVSKNPFGGNLFGGTTATANPADAVKPLVEQVDSRFIVTVEVVSLVAATAATGPAAESAPESAPANTP